MLKGSHYRIVIMNSCMIFIEERKGTRKVNNGYWVVGRLANHYHH